MTQPSSGTSLLTVLVGSRLKGFNQSSNTDYDLRGLYVANPSDLFHPFKGNQKWDRHYKSVDDEGREIDLDAWELRHAVNLMYQGSPLIVTQLYSTSLWSYTDLGLEAIANREKFISQKLQLGAIKFANSKVRRAEKVMNRPDYITTQDGQYRPPGKYIVYGLAAISECWQLLTNGAIDYPLTLWIDEMNALRSGDMKAEDGIAFYEAKREEFRKLNNPYRFDRQWVSNWVIRCHMAALNGEITVKNGK